MSGKARHGHCSNERESPTYRSWHSMVGRCTSPTHNRYPTYGAKGIKVCERWRTFDNFLSDMGERPKGTSLDRFPNRNGNYEPGNVRWATPAQQVANRDCSVMLVAEGRKQTVGEWAREKGLPYIQLHRRLFVRKWPVERALNEPLKVYRPRRPGHPM